MARCDSEKYFKDERYRPDMTIRDMMEAGITPKPKSRDNRSLWEVLGIPEPKNASRERKVTLTEEEVGEIVAKRAQKPVARPKKQPQPPKKGPEYTYEGMDDAKLTLNVRRRRRNAARKAAEAAEAAKRASLTLIEGDFALRVQPAQLRMAV